MKSEKKKQLLEYQKQIQVILRERLERNLILEEKEMRFVMKICKFRYIIYKDKNIFSSTLRKESIIL